MSLDDVVPLAVGLQGVVVLLYPAEGVVAPCLAEGGVGVGVVEVAVGRSLDAGRVDDCLHPAAGGQEPILVGGPVGRADLQLVLHELGAAVGVVLAAGTRK